MNNYDNLVIGGKKDWSMRVITTVFIAAGLFCCFGIYKSVQQSQQAYAACEKKDGVLVRTKSTLVCFDKKAIL